MSSRSASGSRIVNHEPCTSCGRTANIVRRDGDQRLCGRCVRPPTAVCADCGWTRPCYFAPSETPRCEAGSTAPRHHWTAPGAATGRHIWTPTPPGRLNWVQFARWPGVRTRDSGRQRPSALRWILLVNPPRERPRPSPPTPPPPGGRRGSATASRPGVLPSRPPLKRALEVGRCGRRPRVGERGRWWSRPRCPSRSHLSRRRQPGSAGADAPIFRPRTTAGGVRRRCADHIAALLAGCPDGVPVVTA
ncbi:hypothetical protein QF027_000217 [Streptomyces canus]|nr:hypothetical protein [Streptomyces canus]